MRAHAKTAHLFALVTTVTVTSLSMGSLPRVAHACDCAGTYAYAVWPRDGATDVPRDTPIVIERQNFFGPTDVFYPVLVDDTGNAIELEEVRVLPRIGIDCAFQETVFLRPAAPLPAGEQLTLRFESNSDDDAGVPDFLGQDIEFSVGDGLYEAVSEDLSVTYLHVGRASECTEEPCAVAEVVLELDEEPSVPYWLEVESDAERHNAMRMMLAPSDWFDPPSNRKWVDISALVPSTDRCVRLAVYALDGTALIDEERCTPDECVLSDSWSFSDCGEPPGTSVDARSVSGTSCDDPQVFDPMGDAGVSDAGARDAGENDAGDDEDPRPTLDAGSNPAGDADASVQGDDGGGGCNCSVRGGAKPLDAGLWLALLVLLRRRARSLSR